MEAIFLALVAMVSFGIASFIYKVASPHIDPHSLVVATYGFAFILALTYWSVQPTKEITTLGIFYSFLAALFAMVGMLAYVTALKHGMVSIVVPLRNLSLTVSVILAILLLAERLTWVKVLGILLACVAIVLLSV